MKFRTQAAHFMVQSMERRRNPICQSTAIKYETILSNNILPLIGDLELGAVDNSSIKGVVEEMVKLSYSPSTIQTANSLIRAVVASAVDANGNELYPRNWNNDFIDAPPVNPADQKAPMAPLAAIQQALGTTSGQDKALIALLAGTGLRIDEALNLTHRDWDNSKMTLSVTKSKTPAGVRTVDLAPELNAFLEVHLPGGESLDSKLFGLNYLTVNRHMKSVGLPPPHSMRRYRLTHLRSKGTPEGLCQYWIGHAKKTVTDRYDKIAEDLQARQEWASRVGLGFKLEIK